MKALPAPSEPLQRASAYFLAFTMALAVLVMFERRPWIDPNLFQTLLFLLAGVWAGWLVVRPFRVRFSLPMFALAAAALWGLLQVYAGWTLLPSNTWVAVLLWMGNLVAFTLALQICPSSRIRGSFLDLLLHFAFAISVVSVVQYFSWNGRIFWLFPVDESVALGPFLNRDQYAVFIEMVLPLALVQTLAGGSRSIRFGVMSAAMYASVIAGASRAGALLVTAEIILIPLVLWAKGRLAKQSMRAAALNVWLLAAVFVAVVGWAVLWARFDDPDPLKGRREILQDTIAMIQARPQVGFGLGTFRTAFPAYASVDFGSVVNHAHNDWAEWAADGGIPFSVFIMIIAAWSVPKAIRSVWGIGLLAVFAHSFLDFALQKGVLNLWMFALLGALAAETGKRNDQKRVA